MQHAPPQGHPQDMGRVEINLREQLLAAEGPAPSPYPPPPMVSAPGPDHGYPTSNIASPHDHLDPNVSHQHQAPYAQMGGEVGDEDGGEDGLSPQGGKGKRELSTSKRAAQNRAAQRAFRQRKEGYIKKLEEQVKELSTMESNYRGLQNENYGLREYILNLQSRLLERDGEYPPAPSHINLMSLEEASAARESGAPRALMAPPSAIDSRLQEMPSHGLPPPSQQRPHGLDAMSQLQAAAAQADAVQTQQQQQQHQSPYGLGVGAEPYPNPNKRQRVDEKEITGGDVVKAGP